MDSWLLAQKAQIAAIETEVQGMIALNQYRLRRDESLAYDDASFQAKARELMYIAETILKSR